MSDEEAAAHRAPGTIVQNNAVFCDRSARCAAVSRSFSPRGLLWLFLRKKEQKKISCEKYGLKPAERTPLWRASAGGGFGPRGAQRRSLLQTECFLRTFGLTQKYQKVKHGEKSRETFGVSLKRAPVAGLQANRPRFLTFDTARFFFRAFRSAVVQAFGLRKRRIPTRGSAYL